MLCTIIQACRYDTPRLRAAALMLRQGAEFPPEARAGPAKDGLPSRRFPPKRPRRHASPSDTRSPACSCDCLDLRPRFFIADAL